MTNTVKVGLQTITTMIKIFLVTVLTILCSGLNTHAETGLPSSLQAAGNLHETINPNKNGKYSAGDWTYYYVITNPGTRSQGSIGRLSYKNLSVPVSEDPMDYYETPLGIFSFVGFDGTPWKDRGWVLLDPVNSRPASDHALPWPDQDYSQLEKKKMKALIEKLTVNGFESPCFQEMEDDFSLTEKDFWGTLYRTSVDIRGGEGGGEVYRLVMTSAGQDKLFNSEDDIVSYSKFFSSSLESMDLEKEMPRY